MLKFPVSTMYGGYGNDRQKISTISLYLHEQAALIKAGEMTEEQFKSNLDRTEALLNAEAEKSMRPKTGRFMSELTFDADKSTQHHSNDHIN